jgi:hypothetical protein
VDGKAAQEILDAEPSLDADLQLWLQNYQLLHATRPAGWDGLGDFSLTDIHTLHRKYRWEEKGIEFDYYVRTLLALDEVTREHHKKAQPPPRANG